MTSILIIIIMITLILVQVNTMLQMKQMTFQETYQLGEATDFPLGQREGFTFAYRVINKNNSMPFNIQGYLNVDVI